MPTVSPPQTQPGPDTVAIQFADRRREHWDRVASASAPPASSRRYARLLAGLYQAQIMPHARVLEIGCGQGDLLAALQPSRGLGIDLSPVMVDKARARHRHLEFAVQDVHDLKIDEQFDYIVLSDLVNDLWDVQVALRQLHRCCHAGTRVLINFYSRLWQWPLGAARRLGLARPILPQNWLTRQDMVNLLELSGFDVIRGWSELMLPVDVPLLGPLCNRVLARLWPMQHLDLVNMMIARPATAAGAAPTPAPPTVSVIVPARNEAGNIADLLTRVPQMGGGTQIVFVEGNSTDDTYATIERAIQGRSDCVLYRQTGKGKGDAVRLGFAQARGDVLMILDADLTVPPETLPQFFDALHSGHGEFINGVRLVYPMEDQAMRLINLCGNKFFSWAFSWLLGQPIKDTLCGTKVLRRAHYQQIAANRAYFGEFDPFGDFDLIFGAARLNLKIVDLPVRYRQRTYGETNIDRWRHGWLLLKMVAFAMRKLKFR
jgi:SAM-dependent methyltransferase